MTKQNSNFGAIQRLLILVSFLILLAACTPIESETPTPPTAVSTPNTLAAEPITTARPTSEPTATAIPQQTATSTNIPPTSTPRPTNTPEPTLTPTPYPGPWPPINHDLLIWAESWNNGTLKLWHHDTRELEILLSPVETVTFRDNPPVSGGISALSVSLDGQTIVAGRNQIDDPTLSELVSFNRETLEPQTPVADIPLLREIAVSPDGRYVAYRSDEPAPIFESELPLFGYIFLHEIGSQDQPVKIGHCLGRDPEEEDRGCLARGMIWSPDGEKILWSDGRGVMAYDLITGNTDLLQANNYDLPEDYQVKVYRPIDWSPNGRFLRLDEFHYEGGLEVILDTQTKQLIEIPNTWSYEGPQIPHGIWLSDSRFLLVQPDRESGEYTTIVEIWRPSPGNSQLILDGSITMPTGPQTIPKQPFQFPDGALAIGILGLEPTDPTSGIYRLETLFSPLEQLNQIPDVEWIWYGNDIIWEPGGSGVIIEGQYEKNEMVFIPTSETTAYDMVPIIGRNIRQLYWLP